MSVQPDDAARRLAEETERATTAEAAERRQRALALEAESAAAAAALEAEELRAERDAYQGRALEAESLAEQLADELAAARRTLAGQAPPDDSHSLSLFDDVAAPEPDGRLAADGSDRAVPPLVLGATALVAALVAVLTVASGGPWVFTVAMLVLAAVLGWTAHRTRVVPVRVDLRDGTVEVERRGDTKHFDLRSDQVRLDVRGAPEDADWRVRFHRRSLDPVDIDASMVDPADFMAHLREHRPGG